MGEATVYPAPAGETPSPRYEVRVTDRSGDARRSFVYFDPARQVTPGNYGAELQRGRSFSWTTFETDGPVRVQVVRKEGPFASAALRPSRYGLNANVVNRNTIEFVIRPGQKVSVEFNTEMGKCYDNNVDCVRDILMIFADPKATGSPIAGVDEADVYRPRPGIYATNAKILNTEAAVVSAFGDAQGKRAVVFGPGVYVIGYWRVPNNVEHVHLEGGAIVYGAIDVLPLGAAPGIEDYLKTEMLTLRRNFMLTGHGILSGRKIPWHMTKDFSYCADDCWWKLVKSVQLAAANFTVSDITIADSPHWSMTFTNDAEPSTTGVMSGFKIVAQWSYNNDGPPARGRIDNCFVQANDDVFKLTSSGSAIQGCTVWQFGNGAAFQLGWYGKTISRIRVSGIDVIHSEAWSGLGDNLGFLNYAKAQTGGVLSGEIRDLTFSDIRLEGKVLRLIGLTPQSGQKIEGVRFTNTAIDAWRYDAPSSERANYLDAINGGSIDGIVFENVTVGGQRLTQANFTTTGRFQTTGDVSNLVFSLPN